VPPPRYRRRKKAMPFSARAGLESKRDARESYYSTIIIPSRRRDPAVIAAGCAWRAVKQNGVICGLDPRIHRLRKKSFEEDGLPGQARQ
jgi:hypothetical protein